MCKELVFKFKTSTNKGGSVNLLEPCNLEIVGIKQEDIEKVETFFEVPGILYSEPEVASETHPTGGSIGVWVYTKQGSIASIQDIIYYDFNPGKTHFSGQPHWNHERRFIDKEGKTQTKKDIEYHVIEDSEWIEVYFGEQRKTINKKQRQ
jgi:hypothetical protein